MLSNVREQPNKTASPFASSFCNTEQAQMSTFRSCSFSLTFFHWGESLAVVFEVINMFQVECSKETSWKSCGELGTLYPFHRLRN